MNRFAQKVRSEIQIPITTSYKLRGYLISSQMLKQIECPGDHNESVFRFEYENRERSLRLVIDRCRIYLDHDFYAHYYYYCEYFEPNLSSLHDMLFLEWIVTTICTIIPAWNLYFHVDSRLYILDPTSFLFKVERTKKRIYSCLFIRMCEDNRRSMPKNCM